MTGFFTILALQPANSASFNSTQKHVGPPHGRAGMPNQFALVHRHCERLRCCRVRRIVAGRIHRECVCAGSCSRITGAASATTTRTAAATASCEASERKQNHKHSDHRSPSTPLCRNAEEYQQRQKCSATRFSPSADVRLLHQSRRRRSGCHGCSSAAGAVEGSGRNRALRSVGCRVRRSS